MNTTCIVPEISGFGNTGNEAASSAPASIGESGVTFSEMLESLCPKGLEVIEGVTSQCGFKTVEKLIESEILNEFESDFSLTTSKQINPLPASESDEDRLNSEASSNAATAQASIFCAAPGENSDPAQRVDSSGIASNVPVPVSPDSEPAADLLNSEQTGTTNEVSTEMLANEDKISADISEAIDRAAEVKVNDTNSNVQQSLVSNGFANPSQAVNEDILSAQMRSDQLTVQEAEVKVEQGLPSLVFAGSGQDSGVTEEGEVSVGKVETASGGENAVQSATVEASRPGPIAAFSDEVLSLQSTENAAGKVSANEIITIKSDREPFFEASLSRNDGLPNFESPIKALLAKAQEVMQADLSDGTRVETSDNVGVQSSSSATKMLGFYLTQQGQIKSNPEASSISKETALGAFIQTVKVNDGLIPIVEQPSPVLDLGEIAKSVISQIVGKAQLLMKGNGAEMKIKLRPPALGDLTIRVILEEGILTARLNAASQTVRGVLENSLPQLKQGLEEKGVRVDRFIVDVGGDQIADGDTERSASQKQDYLNFYGDRNAPELEGDSRKTLIAYGAASLGRLDILV